MSVSERQLAAFADQHAWQIPYDVSPRHLAGPGDARHVTHGLAAAGWSLTSDPLSAEILLHSPDHRYRLQFDPQSATFAWWRLRAEPAGTESGWYAEFGQLVPAEVLAHLTDALLASPSHLPDPWQTVTAAGWLRDPDGTAHSPDSMCTVELRPVSEFRERPSWRVEVRQPDHGSFPGPRIWHAFFDERAPAHLVGAFLAALADHRPLQRGMFDRTAHYSAVKESSALRAQQVVDAHTSRIKALGGQVRAARRNRPKATTPRARAGSTQPAARR
ncbi:DUF317 domain-containing protein [Streptomyces anthocyanicus]|uniref:DUF317 domain-containing protein n=1 Tax=Streptomyces anthocyanicus TaxID=68174 RepID=UPI00166FFF43|nr:DUF317 domain-containing protein [Streptomyces anthocyanicus]